MLEVLIGDVPDHWARGGVRTEWRLDRQRRDALCRPRRRHHCRAQDRRAVEEGDLATLCRRCGGTAVSVTVVPGAAGLDGLALNVTPDTRTEPMGAGWVTGVQVVGTLSKLKEIADTATGTTVPGFPVIPETVVERWGDIDRSGGSPARRLTGCGHCDRPAW